MKIKSLIIGILLIFTLNSYSQRHKKPFRHYDAGVYYDHKGPIVKESKTDNCIYRVTMWNEATGTEIVQKRFFLFWVAVEQKGTYYWYTYETFNKCK